MYICTVFASIISHNSITITSTGYLYTYMYYMPKLIPQNPFRSSGVVYTQVNKLYFSSTIHMDKHTHTYTHILSHTRTLSHTHTHTHTPTHPPTHPHTRTHTHTQTHTRARAHTQAVPPHNISFIILDTPRQIKIECKTICLKQKQLPIRY